MEPPASVLDRYAPLFAGLRWRRVSGGFSGAEVWRGDDSTGAPFAAIKAWPSDYPVERLTRVHAWMARAAHLPFVPAILPTTDQQTLVLDKGRAWEAARWMPGEPKATPSESEVETACDAVARLHAACPSSGRLPCPGVSNRLRLLRDWLAAPRVPDPSDQGSVFDAPESRSLAPRVTPEASPTTQTPLHPGGAATRGASRLLSADISTQLDALLRRATTLVTQAAPAAIDALQPWEEVPLRVQPCVRDLRGEHVLWTGPTVTGIVDYGAMAEDHPAVDLARLLSDYARGNGAIFAAGLRAYRAAGGVLDAPDEFVAALVRGGVLGSAITWLLRARLNRRADFDGTAAEARLGNLVIQIEHPVTV